MRAVVFGSNGQDGSYLCESLLRRGFEVFGLARDPVSRYVAPTAGFHHRRLDLEDYEGLRQFLASVGPSHVFHFAAVHGAIGDGFSYESRWDAMMRVNVLALHAALEFARLSRPDARIFYAGSCKMYPPPLAGVIDERTPARATCLYSIGKIAARDLMAQYAAHGVRSTNLVLFNHDSPRRSSQFLLPKIARLLARARRDRTAVARARTLEIHIDWGYAGEFMDIVADLASAWHEPELVMASGVTVHAREVIAAAFARHGLRMEDHLVEDLRGDDPTPAFRVSVARLADVARTPAVQVAELIDLLVEAPLPAGESV